MVAVFPEKLGCKVGDPPDSAAHAVAPEAREGGLGIFIFNHNVRTPFWGPFLGTQNGVRLTCLFFWGPHFGAHNSDPKTRSIFPLFFVKVVAFYRWLNGALNGSPKLPLIVNMDECSLAYHQTGIRGTVLRTQPLRSVRPEDRARLGDRRGNITYMASICNDPSVSNVLPQILLGNCQRFAKRVVEELKPSLPGNLFLWREKSAWNNRFQMRRYIKLLRQCLGDEVFQMREVFLVVDMASCHLHPSIPAVARSQGLRMGLGTSWVDVHLTASRHSRFSAFPGQDAGALACLQEQP